MRRVAALIAVVAMTLAAAGEGEPDAGSGDVEQVEFDLVW